MSVLVVIPARYASVRYPGKPLVPLRGAGGYARTLIRRTWDAAREVPARVVVATDDDRIADHARGFGAEVVMTSPDCANGTERCAEAAAALGGRFDVVVNLQGDAPLTPPWFVTACIEALMADRGADMATPVLRTDGRALRAFLNDRMAGQVGATTAVFRDDMRALYFSKEVLPYTGADYSDDASTPVWHHVGVYSYRPEALADYATWPMGRLERLEGLEQLRFLEHGRQVRCVEVSAQGRRFWELNTPTDVARIENILAAEGRP